MKKQLFSLFLILYVITGCARVSVDTDNLSYETTANEGYSLSQTLTGASDPIYTDQEDISSENTSGSDITVTQKKSEQPSTVLSSTASGTKTPSAVSKATAASDYPSTAAVTQQATGNSAMNSTASARQNDVNPAPSSSVTAEPSSYAAPAANNQTNTCTIRIECKTIQNNIKKLKTGKSAFLPTNGIILDDTSVELKTDDTAFSVLQRACKDNVCTDNCQYCQNGGIQLEYTFTPGFNTYYIEGIHQIYEKDCGTMSGWMFSVNGKFPDEGASTIKVYPGDRIIFCFTCDMGDDVGNHFEG